MKRLLAALSLAFCLTLVLGAAPAAHAASTFSCKCNDLLGVSIPNGDEEFCTVDQSTCAEYCEDLQAGSPTKPEVSCESTPDEPTEGSDGTSAAATPDRTVVLVNPLEDCPPGAKVDDPCRTTIPKLVGNVIRTAIGVVGALALLIFVYGGFLWLTSAGEAAKIQAGKDAMKWAIIGLAVVFSSYALVSFVLSAFSK